VSRLLAVSVVLLVLAAAGCGGGGDSGNSVDSSSGSSGTATLKPGEAITMKSLQFHPDDVQVKVGEQVTWRNDESIPHNVIAQSGADFKSETFGKDQTFTWTPDTAGTVKYECTLHPGMTGTIDVVQ